MNSLVKLGIIGGGLALLFRDQIAALFQDSPVSTDQPPASGSTPEVHVNLPAVIGPVQAKPPADIGSEPGHKHPSTDLLDIAVKVSTAAGANAMLNADQWNWHWSNQSGVQQTADLFPPENRSALMPIKDYLARRAAAGLSGLVHLGRAR